MSNENKRGGKRAGAGRKPGAGRVAVSSSITLTPERWDRLDALRGELTRSAWIASKIQCSIALPCLTCILLLVGAQKGHCGEEQRLDGLPASLMNAHEVGSLMQVGANSIDLTNHRSESPSLIQEVGSIGAGGETDNPPNDSNGDGDVDHGETMDVMVGLLIGTLIWGAIILILGLRSGCFVMPIGRGVLNSSTNVKCPPTGATEKEVEK